MVPCRAVPEHEGLDDGLVQRGLCLHLSLSVADAGTLELLFPLLARVAGHRARRGVGGEVGGRGQGLEPGREQ